MKSKLFVILILAAFGSEEYENAENGTKSDEKIKGENSENSIIVKIEESDYVKKQVTSEYIGVAYNKNTEKWRAQRWSKTQNKRVYNGYYEDEVTAAQASDTLARKLMDPGHKLKLNFPDDETEVHKKRGTSQYVGVSYNKPNGKWYVTRRSKSKKNMINGGYYDVEETAAHASDTLARKLMENGEQGHNLNFPDDDTEVHKKTHSSKFYGVAYYKPNGKWFVQRWRRYAGKTAFYGLYNNEETAAHASDTLARELMENGEPDLKLNFPDDDTKVHPNAKQSASKYCGVTYNSKTSKWRAGRWGEGKKNVYGGSYDNEETAAHASDTVARNLMANGEQHLKLNFPDDHAEVCRNEYQKMKRKRQGNFQDN